MNRIRSLVLTIAVASLMGAGAVAQVSPAPTEEPGGVVTPGEPNENVLPPAAAPTIDDTTTTVPRDDGFDWGWIGLVGLLGLAGLSGRGRAVEPVPTHVAPRTTAARPDPTTPPRR